MANPRTRRGAERATRTPLRVPDVVVPADREEPRPVVLPGVALAAGILLFVFLLRLGWPIGGSMIPKAQVMVDILPWVLVLVLFALVLHSLLAWLAESELLSAPWLLIIVLAVGAATWMLWPE